MEKGMDKFSDEFDNKNENLNQDNFISEEKIRERVRKIEHFIKSLNAPKDIEEKYLNNLRDGMNDIQNRKESEYGKSLKEYNDEIEKIELELDGIIKQGVLHHIKGDESLSDICSKYYGDGNVSKLLIELGYKQVLTPGSLILLPKQLGDTQIQDKYKHLDPYKQFELFESGQGLYYDNIIEQEQGNNIEKLEFRIQDTLSLNETMHIISLSKYLGQLPDKLVEKGLLSQTILFNEDAMSLILNTNYNVSLNRGKLLLSGNSSDILNQLQQEGFDSFKQLQEFIKTPKGRQILEDTLKFKDYAVIYTKFSREENDKQKQKGQIETKDNSIPDFLLKYQEYLGNLGQINNELNERIITLKKSNSIERDRLPIIKQQYLNKIMEETKGFVKVVANTLVDISHPCVNYSQVFELNIGELRIKLNFGKIQITNPDDKENTKQEIANGFDKIYRDSLGELFVDSFYKALNNAREKPSETAIEGGAIVIAGLTTASIVAGSEGWGVLKAGTVFSVVHNSVKATGYGLLYSSRGKSTMEGIEYGMGYSSDMSTGQYFGKKALEYGGNYILFGMFKRTDIAMGSMGVNQLLCSIPNTFKGIATKGLIEGGKVGVEAGFFTGFQIFSGTLENTILDNSDKGIIEKIGQHFDELNNRENIINSLVYNLMFVATIKGSGKLVGSKMESPIQKSERVESLNDKLCGLNIELRNEMVRLDSMGYRIVNMSYDGKKYNLGLVNDKGHYIQPKSVELNLLSDILRQMNTAGKELFELRYVIQQNQAGKNHKSSGQESNVINAEKTKGVKDGKAENHNSGNSAAAVAIIVFGDLQRALTGFKGGDNLSKGFEEFANNELMNYNLNDFSEIEKLSKDVKVLIELEMKYYTKKDQLTSEEIKLAEKLGKDFVNAMTDKVRLDKGEINELDKKYGDPIVMAKLMGKINSNLLEKNREGLYTKYIIDNPEQMR